MSLRRRINAVNTSDFLLAMVIILFLKIVMLPAHSENCMCSHPRTGDVTAEKTVKIQ